MSGLDLPLSPPAGKVRLPAALLRLLQRWQKPVPPARYAAVSPPRFEPRRQPGGTQRAARLDARLASPRAPLELRMNALMAVQHVPPRHVSGLLRQALGESSDDLRLLAYGILDGKEKVIAGGLQGARAALQQATSREQTHAAARQLAELQLELVYQGLVQGELRRQALAEGRRHADMALHCRVDDAGLWLLSARLHLHAGQAEAAGEAFSRAVLMGLPEARVHPYLAELAFLRGDYAAVRAHLAQLPVAARTQQMALLADFWVAA
jgi:hypothetical protein